VRAEDLARWIDELRALVCARDEAGLERVLLDVAHRPGTPASFVEPPSAAFASL
jgi:hypothetical protein